MSLIHIGVVGTGDLRMVRGDCELTQRVNSGLERGFGVVLCKLWTLVAFITAAMGAICSTTVPVGTRLHWSTDFPACMGRLRQNGQCCGREAQCGWRTKINWTKAAHNTCICTCICGDLGLVPIHTRTHRCVDTGWALSLLKASARGGWEIGHPRQPTTKTWITAQLPTPKGWKAEFTHKGKI